jgi:hypothetical protein
VSSTLQQPSRTFRQIVGRRAGSRATLVGVRVLMEHDDRGRYWSTIQRDDGIVLFLPGYDRKWRVPHDLAHVVTEKQLRLNDGVFGSIAAGAMFENMRVLSGRLRHDPRQRSRQVLRANGPGIGVAELLAGAVHTAVEQRAPGTVVATARRAWGSLREGPFPYPYAELRNAVEALEDLGQRWSRLTADAQLTVDWP